MPTVQKLIDDLGFGEWIDKDTKKPKYSLFSWPPDAFAVAATILRESGAYLQAARPHIYPADHQYNLDEWKKTVERVAAQWRTYGLDTGDPPRFICSLLDDIAERADEDIASLSVPSDNNFSWYPFLALLVCADQSCRGAGSILGGESATDGEGKGEDNGYPSDSVVSTVCMQKLLDYFENNRDPDGADSKVFSPLTLCHRVSNTKAVVLPKMRTSQRGATIRSFSLYLSLLNGTDIEPRWHGPGAMLLRNHQRPKGLRLEQSPKFSTKELVEQAGPYNVLLYPWPFQIRPSQYAPLSSTLPCLGGRPADPNRFFAYTPDSSNWADKISVRLHELVKRAEILEGPVHGIVLPEMALSRSDFDRVFSISQLKDVDFVACGVHESGMATSELGKNYTMVRYRASNGDFAFVKQEKHHRWALDPKQVSMYGLSSILNPSYTWWEGISLPRRSLNFFSLDTMVAYTVLICEDLARPDPVADGVRAVGPNLVICLLMDGPQLVSRWSARYATVLAEDPGSSIITLSSLGMVRRSRQRSDLHLASRVVALWREAGESACELSLDTDSEALLLSLYPSQSEERTLDGRSDEGMATTLRLSTVHQLGLPDSREVVSGSWP